MTSFAVDKIIAYQKLMSTGIYLGRMEGRLIVGIAEFKLIIHIKLKDKPIRVFKSVSCSNPDPVVK